MTREISVYIRELLFRHDCVIIPGFGAFIGNYIPARIDREEGMFYPPARKITFNRHLTGNDGLLTGHISALTGTPYGETRDAVIAWGEELRRRINSGERVNLDLLGTFSLNRDGAVIFDPDSSANYLLSSYGLTSYHRQPVTDFDVSRKVLEHARIHVPGQPSVRKLLTRAAVAIPLIVALALVPFNERIFKGRLHETTLNPLASAELEFNRSQIDRDSAVEKTRQEDTGSVPAADSQPAVTETAVGQTAAAAETAPEPQAPASVSSSITYKIITGSFKDEANAMDLAEALRKKGFDPEVMKAPDGYTRVSAASVGSLEKAKDTLRVLSTAYPGAWIHKITKQ